MPTDNTVQTHPGTPASTPAPGSPPADSTQPSLTDDAIKSHPLYRDLETRYAAAHKEIDGKKTKKELEAEVARLKVLAGEASVPEPILTPVPTGSFDTARLTEEIEFNIANREAIKLAGQPYIDLVSKGIDRQQALNYALGILPNAERSVAENLRAQVSASAGGSMDRTPTPTPQVSGLSKEYIESLRKKYPTMAEEKIVEIAQRSVARTQERGA